MSNSAYILIHEKETKMKQTDNMLNLNFILDLLFEYSDFIKTEKIK